MLGPYHSILTSVTHCNQVNKNNRMESDKRNVHEKLDIRGESVNSGNKGKIEK